MRTPHHPEQTVPLVEWICSSRRPFNDGAVETTEYKPGGALYDEQAFRALRALGPVTLRQYARPARPRSVVDWVGALAYLVAFARHRPSGRMVVWDGGSLFHGVVRPGGGRRHVGMVHHVPGKRFAKRDALANRLFLRNLRRLDVVVGVSEFWRSQLLALGARRVEIVHNAIPDVPLEFEPEEVREFGRRHGFADDVPLVYLGTSERDKGVVEAYRALAGESYQFAVSGGHAIPELPVPRLDLAKRDYLLLLRRSDVAVVMSQLVEGWCRTAQEAMLCGTPVVGSGLGGMGELLEGGRQVVCASFADLPAAVRSALAAREGLSERGRRFVESFTRERFEERWRSLAQSLLREDGTA